MLKILSIDGGGIRGIIPAMVLNEIERKTSRPISALFDLIVGTSTGGILTILLTLPTPTKTPKYTAVEVINIYCDLGQSIFKRSLFHTLYSVSGLIRSKYNPNILEELMKQYCGISKVSDTLTNIVIPTYDMQSATPTFYKTRYAQNPQIPDENPYLWQVARATSAAPTYYPTSNALNIPQVDGGLFANNPALCAYAEAKKTFPAEQDILLVSLGTGDHTTTYPYQQCKNWGLLQWAPSLMGVVFNGLNKTVEYQLNNILNGQPTNEHYYRFQIELEKQDDTIDNATPRNIDRLVRYGNQLILNEQDKLRSVCQQLKN